MTCATWDAQVLCETTVLPNVRDWTGWIFQLHGAHLATKGQRAKLPGAVVVVLLQGRTSIFVAHRLSTVLGCDRILVLSEGRLVEQGSHSQLIEAGGVYAGEIGAVSVHHMRCLLRHMRA